MDSSVIIAARNRKNLTQQELSNLSGISIRTIQRLERGEVIPRPHTIRKIEEILEINTQVSSKEQHNKLNVYLLIQWSSVFFPFIYGLLSYVFWKRNQWDYNYNLLIKRLVSLSLYTTVLFPSLIFIVMLFLRNYNVPSAFGKLPTPLMIYWVFSLIYAIVVTFFITKMKKGEQTKLSAIPCII